MGGLLGACQLWPQLLAARRVAHRERIFLLLALCRDSCAAHAEGMPALEQIQTRGEHARAWQRRAFRRPPHHRHQNQRIPVLPGQHSFMSAAHSARRLSISGNFTKSLFDHLRFFFHRPRVAQLFQDQVTCFSGRYSAPPGPRPAGRNPRRPCSERSWRYR
jgi:hypothetical protein